MNCWPKCIAYVVKLLDVTNSDDPTAKGQTDIRGTIVRCTRLVDGDKWELETPVRVAYTVFGKDGLSGGYGDITAMGDEFLRPLDNPGDDAVDETLLRLPSPRQEVTA